MQNLIAENILTMSSREIAELTEKKHSKVLRDIEGMLIELEEDPEAYIHFWTHPQKGQQTEYLLGRYYTFCLLTGVSATHLTRVIERWQALEQLAVQPAISQTHPHSQYLAY